MNTQKQIFLIVVLFFVFTGACAAYTAIDLPIRAEDQTQWHFDESVERGALLFANNCRTCHGNAGQGGVGPQLNREEWRNQDPIVLKTNKDMIRRTITCGRAGTAMPTWGQLAGGPLNAVQVEHIVDFLTAPADDEENEEGPNKGWIEAVEFAHNLNGEASAVVGGDTLSTIALAHNIGYQDVADLNGLEPTSAIPKNTKIKLPPNGEFPNGRTVKILSDNATVVKVTNDFEVGAMLIADLNGLDYEFDPDTNQLTLRVDGREVPGLLPGDELELPDGATYIVRAEDTLDSIAETHNLSASAIRGLNQDILNGLANSDPIPHERTLELPPDPVWKARVGDTLGLIATLHGIEEADLISANPDIEDPEGDLVEGQLVTLPDDASYVIQAGDTLFDVAMNHNIGEAELAELNDLEVGDPISPAVILALPEVDAYVVQGQTLEEVAEGFSNGNADDFAETNNISADDPLRVGTQLALPDDVWGVAPSTSVNLGTGCTQFTISNDDYMDVIGATEPVPTAPAQTSTNVTIVANSNDWTVTANGTAMAPNEGAVSVVRGTTINFSAAVGIHTITLETDGDEEVVNDDFAGGDTDTVTFNDTGTFAILCDVHPAMLAYVFVQEAGAASPTTASGTPTATTTPGGN